MKYGILLGLFALVLLATTVFAIPNPPVMGQISVTPVYLNDHNYSQWTTPYTMTLTSQVTPGGGVDGDIDINSCQYTINGGFSWINVPSDLNIDSNILTISYQSALTNNHTFGLQCSNTSAGYATPVLRELYLDVSAPQTIASYDGTSAVTYASYDRSISTGIGSGTKRVYYSDRKSVV